MTPTGRPSPLADHSHPSRPDLTNSIAIVVGAPGFMYPGPGYRDASGQWREAPDDTAVKFAPLLEDFERLVAQSTPKVLRSDDHEPHPERYVFGPGRAGMYEAVYYFLQVLPDATELADNVQTWIEVGGWVLWLKAQWRDALEHFRKQGNPISTNDQLIFTAHPVQAACLTHAMAAYGPLDGAATVQMYSRQFNAGSADLPSGGELYHVAVATSRGALGYSVDGRVRVRDHFTTGSNGLTPLDLPDFNDILTDPFSNVGTPSVYPTLHLGSS